MLRLQKGYERSDSFSSIYVSALPMIVSALLDEDSSDLSSVLSTLNLGIIRIIVGDQAVNIYARLSQLY